MSETMLNKLSEKIQIYKKEETRTKHGNIVYTYSLYANTWASVRGTSAKYTNAEYEHRNEIDYTVVTRYRTDIHIKDRIIYRGRTLEIMNEPMGIDGGKRFVLFNCVELVEDNGEV